MNDVVAGSIKPFGSKAWANDLLSYGIKVLKGEAMISRPSGRIHVALLIKEDLQEAGFWWQARTLEFWIHKAMRGDFYGPEGADPRSGAERGGSS